MTQQQLTTDYNAMDLRSSKPTAVAKSEQKQTQARANLRDFCAQWPILDLLIGVDQGDGSISSSHTVYLPCVDADVVAEIRQAQVTLAEGGTFTAEQRHFFNEVAGDYLQKSTVAFEAVNTLTGGGDRRAFEPFNEWAEGLCANKHGLIRLNGADGITVDMRSEGVLKASMQAILLSLTAGRRWEGLTAKMARKAFTSQLVGESEEIAVLGSLSVIGRDKSGYMVKLAERLHEAVDALWQCPVDTDKAAIALFSQVRFTSIPAVQFVLITQAALYGRYAFLCKRLADTAARIVKNGPKAEAMQAKPLNPVKTAPAPKKAKGNGKSAPLPQPTAQPVA